MSQRTRDKERLLEIPAEELKDILRLFEKDFDQLFQDEPVESTRLIYRIVTTQGRIGMLRLLTALLLQTIYTRRQFEEFFDAYPKRSCEALEEVERYLRYCILTLADKEGRLDEDYAAKPQEKDLEGIGDLRAQLYRKIADEIQDWYDKNVWEADMARKDRLHDTR